MRFFVLSLLCFCLFTVNAQTTPCSTGMGVPPCDGCIWNMTPSVLSVNPCILITWEAFPDYPTSFDDNDINVYRIYVSQQSTNGDWGAYSLLDQTEQTIYNISGLENNRTYRIVIYISKLSLLDYCPNGGFTSYDLQFTTPSSSNCTNVANCDAPVASVNSTPCGEEIEWGPVAGAVFYRVKYKQSGDPNWTIINNIAGTTFSLPGFLPGIQYSFQVSSGCTNGSFSDGPVQNLTANSGNINLTTQAAVDNFAANYPGCTSIPGTINIEGAGITNLNGLSSITSCAGLSIHETSLTNCSGLNGLNHIQGNFYIWANPNLLNVSGLEALHDVGGNMEFNSLSINNLNGLNGLVSVGGNLKLFQLGVNSNTDFSGLNSLTTIGGNLDMNYCTFFNQ